MNCIDKMAILIRRPYCLDRVERPWRREECGLVGEGVRGVVGVIGVSVFGGWNDGQLHFSRDIAFASSMMAT